MGLIVVFIVTLALISYLSLFCSRIRFWVRSYLFFSGQLRGGLYHASATSQESPCLFAPIRRHQFTITVNQFSILSQIQDRKYYGRRLGRRSQVRSVSLPGSFDCGRRNTFVHQFQYSLHSYHRFEIRFPSRYHPGRLWIFCPGNSLWVWISPLQ